MTISDITRFESYRPRIVEALAGMGPAPIAPIADAVGIGRPAAHRYCYRLYTMGVLSRKGNGNDPV